MYKGLFGKGEDKERYVFLVQSSFGLSVDQVGASLLEHSEHLLYFLAVDKNHGSCQLKVV